MVQQVDFAVPLAELQIFDRGLGSEMGVSENEGVPYFGVLIIRILLFRVENEGYLISGCL